MKLIKLINKIKIKMNNLYVNFHAIRMSGVLAQQFNYRRFIPNFSANKRSRHTSLILDRFSKSKATFIHDNIAMFISAYLTIATALGGDLINYSTWDLYKYAIVYSFVAGAVFVWTDMFRGSWKSVNKTEFQNIVITVGLVNLIYLPFFLLMTVGNDIPGGYLLLNVIISSALLSLPRFAYQMFWRKAHEIKRSTITDIILKENIIVIGLDDDMEGFLRKYGGKGYRKMSTVSGSGAKKKFNIVGVLDHHDYRVGMQIHNYEIIGTVRDLRNIITQNRSRGVVIDRIVVGEKTLRSGFVREFILRNPGLCVRFEKYNRHKETLSGIKMEDLLQLPHKFALDVDNLYPSIHNKNIMIVNGHSELVVEIVDIINEFNPKKISIVNYSLDDYIKIKSILESKYMDSNTEIEFFNMSMVDKSTFASINPSKVIYINNIDTHAGDVLGLVSKNLLSVSHVAGMVREHKVERMIMVSSNRIHEPDNISASLIRFAEDFLVSMNKATSNKFSAFAVVRFDDFVDSRESVTSYYSNQVKNNLDIVVNNELNEEILITNFDAALHVVQLLSVDSDYLRRKSAKFMVRGIGPLNYKKLSILSAASSAEKGWSKNIKINNDARIYDHRYFSMDEKIVTVDEPGLHDLSYKEKKHFEMKSYMNDIKSFIHESNYDSLLKTVKEVNGK